MRFLYEARKVFIGQSRILRELSLLAEAVNEGENLNFLFEAPAGYGKNMLAYLLMEYLDPDYSKSIQYMPVTNGGKIFFNVEKRFHYIDEAHLLDPQEQIYNELSQHKYMIILGTNNFHLLEKPLVTRCLRFQFVEYTLEELALMVQLQFERRDYRLPFILCKEVASYCRGVPRVAIEMTTRLSLIFKRTYVPATVEEVREVLFEYLGHDSEALSHFDIEYMKALKLAGGTASLQTMVSLTGLPKKTIEEEVEPYLIRKGKLIKTPRGRKAVI